MAGERSPAYWPAASDARRSGDAACLRGDSPEGMNTRQRQISGRPIR